MMSSEESRRSIKSYSGIKLPVEEGDFGSLDLWNPLEEKRAGGIFIFVID